MTYRGTYYLCWVSLNIWYVQAKSTLENSSKIKDYLRIPVQPNLRLCADVNFRHVGWCIEDHDVPLSIGVINVFEVD